MRHIAPPSVELVGTTRCYDGSGLVDGIAGETAAAGCSATANMITHGPMHEIVTRKRTAEDARQAYAENTAGYTVRRRTTQVERLLVAVPQHSAGTVLPSGASGGIAHRTVSINLDLTT
jgi:hypothetical protein